MSDSEVIRTSAQRQVPARQGRKRWTTPIVIVSSLKDDTAGGSNVIVYDTSAAGTAS